MTLDNNSVPIQDDFGVIWINRQGKCHRINGPAWEGKDGNTAWFYDDICVGTGANGFWGLWEKLSEVQRQDLDLHLWLAKYT